MSTLNGKLSQLGDFAYDVGLVDTDEAGNKLVPQDINKLYASTADAVRRQYEIVKSVDQLQSDRVYVLDIIRMFMLTKDELQGGTIDDAVSPIDRMEFKPHISSMYGIRKRDGVIKPHTGVDIALSGARSPIRAVLSGVVVFAGVITGYGNYVCIRHDAKKDGKTIYTGYAHLDKIYVSQGRVSRGKEIGYMGGTSGIKGLTYDPHLHFEVAVGGADSMHPADRMKIYGVDPRQLLKAVKDIDLSPTAGDGMISLADNGSDPAFKKAFADIWKRNGLS